MSLDFRKLIQTLKRKRESEGLSLRGLSSIIGVSFSTLARIERGEGEPDNNSLIRILEWLGEEGRASGLSFENVAFVHFRAAKNVRSDTINCLLQAADILKRDFAPQLSSSSFRETSEGFPSPAPVVRSKAEMEDLARQFRTDLGLDDADQLDALGVTIKDVAVLVPHQVVGFSRRCVSYLVGTGCADWSAMSVPLDASADHWAILRNNRHILERQRVTYLEECWHILLGHKLTRVAKIADAYGRTYDSSEEHDAFYLASACLLPENAIVQAVQQGRSAESVAQQFGTSPELVEYRIKRLGLWRIYKGKEITMSPGAIS